MKLKQVGILQEDGVYILTTIFFTTSYILFSYTITKIISPKKNDKFLVLLGSSFFSWDETEPTASNNRICGFSKTLGLDYKCASIENYQKALEDSKDIKPYPSSTYIKEKEDYIVVRLK